MGREERKWTRPDGHLKDIRLAAVVASAGVLDTSTTETGNNRQTAKPRGTLYRDRIQKLRRRWGSGDHEMQSNRAPSRWVDRSTG